MTSTVLTEHCPPGVERPASARADRRPSVEAFHVVGVQAIRSGNYGVTAGKQERVVGEEALQGGRVGDARGMLVLEACGASMKSLSTFFSLQKLNVKFRQGDAKLSRIRQPESGMDQDTRDNGLIWVCQDF
jgi:hypothetical protein